MDQRKKNALDWKTELSWVAGFLAVSLVLVALVTQFQFDTIEVQLHDNYYVFGTSTTIFRLTFIFYTIKNLYLLVDLMTLRYRVFALLFAIINPIAGLVLVVFTVMVGMLNFQINAVKQKGTTPWRIRFFVSNSNSRLNGTRNSFRPEGPQYTSPGCRSAAPEPWVKTSTI